MFHPIDHREDVYMKKGKKYSDSLKLIDRTRQYDPEEAIALVKKTAKAASIPVTPTSRSAAPSFCRTAPARPCACW